MIRESLGQASHAAVGMSTVTPSPALASEKRKGMDWEQPTTADASKEKSRMEKLGGLLGHVGTALGHQLGFESHKNEADIMIGMFMHTPWPSSEIFRCLPSELSAWIPR